MAGAERFYVCPDCDRGHPDPRFIVHTIECELIGEPVVFLPAQDVLEVLEHDYHPQNPTAAHPSDCITKRFGLEGHERLDLTARAGQHDLVPRSHLAEVEAALGKATKLLARTGEYLAVSAQPDDQEVARRIEAQLAALPSPEPEKPDA